MQPMKNTTEARLDVLQAAVLALAATLPPQRAQFARRLFCAAIADLEEEGERVPAADEAASSMVAAVLATLAHNGA
jgi:hypothetical protein